MRFEDSVEGHEATNYVALDITGREKYLGQIFLLEVDSQLSHLPSLVEGECTHEYTAVILSRYFCMGPYQQQWLLFQEQQSGSTSQYANCWFHFSSPNDLQLSQSANYGIPLWQIFDWRAGVCCPAQRPPITRGGCALPQSPQAGEPLPRRLLAPAQLRRRGNASRRRCHVQGWRSWQAINGCLSV